MKVIFENKYTGDKVIRVDEKYHFLDGNKVLKETIKNGIIDKGEDWEMIEPKGDLYIKGTNERGKDYFRSFCKGIEYHPGDSITIQKNVSFGDGRRDFVIKSFYISDKPNDDGVYEYVYAETICGRSIHLSEVIIKP